VVMTSVWIDGIPVRTGLNMRARMALNSLIGSDYAPMIVTVTQVGDRESATGTEPTPPVDTLKHFLQDHPGLNDTIRAASALR
jgi:hypothetical protein